MAQPDSPRALVDQPSAPEPGDVGLTGPRGPKDAEIPRTPESPPPRHDHGPRATQQIAAALGMSHDGRIELRLDPQELGPVRVALEPGDHVMTVHVSADRTETLDLLRRHSDQLARELRDLGYRDVSFDFGSDRRPDTRQPPREIYDGLAEPETSVAPFQPDPTPVRRAIPSAGLDLRL
jgi:hypothetical protein